MKIRLTLMLVALGAALGGCAGVHKLGALSTPAQNDITPSPNGPIGHRLDELTAMNGPATKQWEMPDGTRAYQWQSSSISATVGPSRKGEIRTAGVSQTTCFYTVYARADSKGVVKVVGAQDPTPGCMTLAMVGQSR